MKKYIFLLTITAFLLGACDTKEEYEQINSKVMEMAGEWYVLYNHNVFGEDPFGAGTTSLITFNTSNDDVDTMWISDEGNFWDYKLKVPINLNSMSFGTTDTLISVVEDYEIKILIQNGIIIKDGVKNLPSGSVSDSIYFEIYFEDLEDATGIAGDTLVVSGFRRTGFIEDEP